MGWSAGWGGAEAESQTRSWSNLKMGGASYHGGEDSWEGGGQGVRGGDRTRCAGLSRLQSQGNHHLMFLPSLLRKACGPCFFQAEKTG